jgi:hypothetical protein
LAVTAVLPFFENDPRLPLLDDCDLARLQQIVAPPRDIEGSRPASLPLSFMIVASTSSDRTLKPCARFTSLNSAVLRVGQLLQRLASGGAWRC